MKRIPWFKVAVVALLALVILPSLASPRNESISAKNNIEGWQKWPKVGEAQLSYLFFDIYQSKLLAPNGYYLQREDDISPHPLALSIEYQRNISQQQLLEATLEQWQKLGYNPQDAQRWLERLAVIFPDIDKGESLTYITDGDTGRFVYSGSPNHISEIGVISDQTLNDAFLSIWLSPNTEYAELRRRLIGVKR